MTVLGLLVSLLVIVVLGIAAHWLIMKFFPEPMRVIALAIVGMVLLIMLFALVMPDIGQYQLWRK